MMDYDFTLFSAESPARDSAGKENRKKLKSESDDEK